MMTVKFNSVKDFVRKFLIDYKKEQKLSDAREDYFFGVSVVGAYDIIMPILNELLHTSDADLVSADLHDYDYDNYDKEFILTLDSIYDIWVQPVFNDKSNRYLYTDEGMTYVHSDTDPKFVIDNHGLRMVEFSIAECDDDFDDECDENYCCEDDDENSIEDVIKKACSNKNITLNSGDDGEMIGFCKMDSEANRVVSQSFYSTDKELVYRALAEVLK